MNTRRNIALTTFLFGIALIPTANAQFFAPPPGLWEDAKSFNGSECQPSVGSQAALLNYPGGDYGGVTNNSNTTVHITCPIVADDTNGNAALPIAVVAWSSANTVNCALQSRAPNGALIQQNVQAGPVHMWPWGTVNKVVANGSYDLYCALPPGQSLFGYELEESWSNANIRTDQNI